MANSLLLDSRQIGVGVFDGLSALVASKTSFDFLWISSFSTSACYGLPDVGILSSSELTSIVRTVHRCSFLPIVVDLDSGHGDLGKIQHVVKEVCHAGASAICIEDNPSSKRSSLYDGLRKELVDPHEHAARVEIAKASCKKSRSDTVVIARTEALVAGLGVKEALNRASIYREAGADAVFIQSKQETGAEVCEFLRLWKKRSPVFLAPTCYATLSKSVLFEEGASHIIFANHAIRAVHKAMREVFEALADAETSLLIDERISTVKELSTEVGVDEILALDNKYGS